jgi:2-methylcitrate dehydratase PrpD
VALKSTVNPRSALGDLAAALAAISPTGSDATSVQASKRLFDTLGATCVGLATPEGRLLRTYSLRARGHDAHSDAAVCCRELVGATRSTEIDDIDIRSCTTTGSVVVPVALNLAASQSDIDGRTLLAAVVAGYEAMIRLGRAISGATALYRGIWPTYVTAAFGASATAAKLLMLDERRTVNALALALTRTLCPSPSALAAVGFRYYALGCAAAEGIDAAIAAAAGVEADADCTAAFAARIGVDFAERELTLGLGESWRIDEVDTKMFPTSRQALASIEAFNRLMTTDRSPSDIEAIVVRVPATYLPMINRPSLPARRIESMIGVQYAIAISALSPESLYDALRPRLSKDSAIQSLMSKIHVLEDDDLSFRFPNTWGSNVTIRWRSKDATSCTLHEPTGSAGDPSSFRSIRSKLERIMTASGIADIGRIEQIAHRCETLGCNTDPQAAAKLLAEIFSHGRGDDPAAAYRRNVLEVPE